MFGFAGEDQIRGGQGNDYLYGNADKDKLWGGVGNDVLLGGELDDELKGEVGVDLLHGGDYHSWPGGRLAIEGDGTDTADYDAETRGITIRLVPSAEGDQTWATPLGTDFTKAIFVTTPGDADNVDTLVSIEKVLGTGFTDTLYIKSLTADLVAGNNHLGGLDVVDFKLNPSGIDNGDHIDLRDMTAGVEVDLTAERLQLASSSSVGFTVKGAERVTGGRGDDEIRGNGEANKLIGNDGEDELRGEGGNDILDGASNDDEGDNLYGGAGADIFKVNKGDTIRDLGGDGTPGNADADGTVYFDRDASLGTVDFVGLAGGSRQAASPTDTSLSGVYNDGYRGLRYEYNELTRVLRVMLQSDHNNAFTIENFDNGDSGINLTIHASGSPPPQASPDQGPPVAGDPLMFDLDGDGVELTNIESTEVYFDTNNDGFVERVGWVGPDDGLLARDLNGDGLINNLSELFGTSTVDGFTILAGHDGNADGVINASDAVWASLRIWRDANTDGDTDAGELRTLAEVGITSISLTAEPVDDEEGGNEIPFRGSFTWANGSLGEAVAAFIQIARADPFISGEGWFEDAEVYLLPELSARDEVRSLRAAMAADADLKADVRALVENVRTLSGADFRAQFEDVLLRWAGVDGIAPDSRGPNLDARHLAFVQQITGDPQYVRGAGGNFEDVSYYPGLGAAVETRFTEIVNQYLMRFGSQLAISEAQLGIDADAIIDGPFAGLLHGTTEYHLDTNVQHFSPTEMGFWIARNAPAGVEALSYLGIVMPFLQGIAYRGSLFLPERPWAMGETALGTGLRAGGMADEALLEFAIDRAHGTERLLVEGTAGNDSLMADPARSTAFIGGAGDDLMIGGERGDTYVYAAGHGDDSIEDYDDSWIDPDNGQLPVDRLLMVGLNAADVTLAADGDDIVLTIAGGGTIRLVGQLVGAGIEEIVFANGDRYSASDIATLTFDAPITAGDDVIDGTRFNDVIDGLAGNDSISGAEGNDILTGGLGDDIMAGNAGDDTYVYTAGDGDDRIIAASGDFTDYERLRLVGIDPDDVTVRWHANGVDLVFEIGGSLPGTITIVPDASDLGIDEVRFDDDVVWTRDELGARAVSSQATDGDDHIVGINAPFGGDVLAGGRGNDILEGLAGHDSYHYRLGDGHDTIVDNSFDGQNGLVLFGILREDVSFERSGEYQDILVLHVDLPEGGSITFSDDAVARIWFADGSSVTPTEIMAELLLTQPTAGDDVIFGTRADDSILGLGGNDRILDYSGENLIDGGDGDDIIMTVGGVTRGGLGDDEIHSDGIVEYAAGDGADILDGFRTRLHLTNIAPGDVSFAFGATQADLLITIGGSQPGSILVTGQWDPYFGGFAGIAEILFGDGSKVTDEEIAEALLDALGTAGNDIVIGLGTRADTLRGRGGDDRLEGGEGADTYIYSQGDGDDLIVEEGAQTYLGAGDRLVLHGIDPADVTVTQAGDDAILNFAGGGSITIADALASLTVIERILFDDGTQWLATELFRQVDPAGDDANLTGTSGADTLTGTGADETYEGAAGNDILVDRGGSDVFLFGAGDGHDVVQYDSPSGGTSIDILRIDALPGEIDVTTIEFATRFRLLATGETITFETSKVDFVEFSDGTRWDGERIALEAVIRGTAGNDTLDGRFGQHDENFHGDGGTDTINPWGGNDTFIYRAGDGFLTVDLYYGAEDLNLGRTDSDTLWLRDIDPADVILSIEPDYTNFGDDPQRAYAGEADLVVRFSGFAGAVRIKENFDELFAPDGLLALERIRFDDGTIWTIDDMMARLGSFGTALPDIIFSSDHGSGIIQGFAGNDRIYEASDGDVIRWSVGDGNDRIIRADQGASLELLDVASTEATLSRDGDDLLIAVGSEVIRVEGQFSVGGTHPVLVGGQFVQQPYDHGVATILFADAVTVTRETIAQDHAAAGTAGDDELVGSRFEESFSGGEGADSIEALGGDDLLDGGGGADALDGGDGDDELTGGLGEDQLEGGLGSDVYRWTLGDGNDVISDGGGRFDGVDELRLIGVDPADVVFERLRVADESFPYDSLQIRIVSTGETIVVTGQYFVAHLAAGYMEAATQVGDGPNLPPFPLTHFVRGMERILFDDDTVVDPNQIGGGELFANPDVIRADPDGQIVLDPELLLGNDVSRFGALMRIVAVGGAEHGAVVLNEDGTITFTAEPSFLGTARFTYTVRSEGREVTGTAVVNVTERVPIIGTAADDTLEGTAFNDTIVGGGGSDTIDGGAGEDTVRFTGSSADYAIYRDADGALVVGDLVGDDGWDTLHGVEFLSFDGDEAMIAVASVAPYGTAGDDNIAGTARADYLFGISGNDTLSGAAGDDWLSGGDDDDILSGGDGDDVLSGDAGEDVMTGGAGNDYYEVDDADDQVIEGVGEGHDAVYATIDHILADNVEELTLGGTATLGTGNQLANLIYANAEEGSYLLGLDGDDSLLGGDHEDLLEGGNGADLLAGGAGDDIMIGGMGDDLYFVGETGDVVWENVDGGTDEVRTGLAAYTLADNVERLTGLSDTGQVLTGNSLANLIEGGAGDDRFEGGLGNDTYRYDAGDGDDEIEDADGVDILQFGEGIAAADVIVSAGEDDSIVLSFDGMAGSVTLFQARLAAFAIEEIRFADGTIWTAADLEEILNPPVNRAPVADAPFEPLTSDEDEAIDWELPAGSFIDPDGDELTITATLANGNPLPGWLTFDGTRLTGTPPANFNGALELLLTASDGTLSVQEPLELIIQAVNDAPVVDEPFSSTHSTEDQAVDFLVPEDLFADVDGDALTLEAALQNGSPLPSWLQFDGTRFTGTPPANFNGSIAIRLTASDGVLSATHDFSLLIDPANDTPRLDALIADAYWRVGNAQTLTIPSGTFSDLDGDSLTWSATLANGSALPSWLSFDGSTRTFSGTPPSGATRLTVRVTASDGLLNASDDFHLAIAGPFANTINGTGSGNTLNGTSSADEIYGLGNNDTLSGGGGNDLLDGGTGDDRLVGGAGDDILIGGDGFDWADYSTNGAALVLDLYDGSRTTGHAVGDTYFGIESYVGTNYSDTFWAGATATIFDGGSSNFATADTVDFSLSTAGITLTLSVDGSGLVQGGGTGGLAEGDYLFSIERIVGTSHNDVYIITGSAQANSVIFVEAAGGGTDEVRTDRSSYALGSELEKLTYIGTGAFTAIGNSLANILTGGASNDVLIGGAGADVLIGGDGFDWASYSSYGTGIVIDLYDGSRSTGDAVGDSYVGIESYIGTNYSDIFWAGATATTFDGASTNFANADTVDFSLSSAAITLTLNVDSNGLVQGTGAGGLATGDVLYSIERIVGTSHDDVYIITGASQANSVAFVEGAGGGTDEVRTDRSTYTLGSELEKLTYIGSGAFTGIGNNLDNVLTGGGGNDALFGGAGADLLIGAGGFDWASYAGYGSAIVIDLYDGSRSTGDAAGDTYSGIESYIGTAYADTFWAGATATTFDGGSSSFGNADTVDFSLSGSGITLTLSVDGNGLVQGAAAGGLAEGDYLYSIERIVGTSHDDVYIITGTAQANSVVFVEASGGGLDEVRTDRSSYTLGAEIEKLTYIGTGNFSGTGNGLANILTGGSGNDNLTGGAGADTFVFIKTLGVGNVDTIADFVSGTDKIHLDDAMFSGIGGLGALGAGAFVTGTAAADADDRIIYNNATGQLYFDADGNGAGGAILFATLTGAPMISASDFTVI